MRIGTNFSAILLAFGVTTGLFAVIGASQRDETSLGELEGAVDAYIVEQRQSDERLANSDHAIDFIGVLASKNRRYCQDTGYMAFQAQLDSEKLTRHAHATNGNAAVLQANVEKINQRVDHVRNRSNAAEENLGAVSRRIHAAEQRLLQAKLRRQYDAITSIGNAIYLNAMNQHFFSDTDARFLQSQWYANVAVAAINPKNIKIEHKHEFDKWREYFYHANCMARPEDEVAQEIKKMGRTFIDFLRDVSSNEFLPISSGYDLNCPFTESTNFFSPEDFFGSAINIAAGKDPAKEITKDIVKASLKAAAKQHEIEWAYETLDMLVKLWEIFGKRSPHQFMIEVLAKGQIDQKYGDLIEYQKQITARACEHNRRKLEEARSRARRGSQNSGSERTGRSGTNTSQAESSKCDVDICMSVSATAPRSTGRSAQDKSSSTSGDRAGNGAKGSSTSGRSGRTGSGKP